MLTVEGVRLRDLRRLVRVVVGLKIHLVLNCQMLMLGLTLDRLRGLYRDRLE